MMSWRLMWRLDSWLLVLLLMCHLPMPSFAQNTTTTLAPTTLYVPTITAAPVDTTTTTITASTSTSTYTTGSSTTTTTSSSSSTTSTTSSSSSSTSSSPAATIASNPITLLPTTILPIGQLVSTACASLSISELGLIDATECSITLLNLPLGTGPVELVLSLFSDVPSASSSSQPAVFFSISNDTTFGELIQPSFSSVQVFDSVISVVSKLTLSFPIATSPLSTNILSFRIAGLYQSSSTSNSSNVCLRVSILSTGGDSRYAGLSLPCAVALLKTSMLPPIISSISPSYLTSSTPTPITLFGSNFLPVRDAFTQYLVGSFYAPVISTTSTQTVITAPGLDNRTIALNWIDTYIPVVVSVSGLKVSCHGDPTTDVFAAGTLVYAIPPTPIAYSFSLCPPAADRLFYCAPCYNTSHNYNYYSATNQPVWTPSGCFACPDGAVCPGGGRVWTQPGYWNQNEFALSVTECAAPAIERCLGGQNSQCGTGYTGTICSLCADDYYADNGICYPCRGLSNQLIGSIFAIGALFIAFGVGLIFLPNRWVDALIVITVSFQQLAQVAQSCSPLYSSSNSGFRQFLSFLQVFVFDYQFINAGCTISALSYLQLFYGTLIFCVCVYAYFLLCAVAHQYLRRDRNTSENWILHPRKPRVARAWIAAFHVTYLTVAVRTLELIHCKTMNDGFADDSGEYRLVVEPSTICYENGHRIAGPLGWIILFFYLLGIPTYFFYLLTKYKSVLHQDVVFQSTLKAHKSSVFSPARSSRSSNAHDRTLEFRSSFGFLYRSLQPRYYWFRLLVYVVSFTVAIQSAFITGNSGINESALFISGGCFFLLAMLTAALAPYVSTWENHASIATGGAKIIAIGILFSVNSDGIASGIAFFALLQLLIASLLAASRRANSPSETLFAPSIDKDHLHGKEVEIELGVSTMRQEQATHSKGKSVEMGRWKDHQTSFKLGSSPLADSSDNKQSEIVLDTVQLNVSTAPSSPPQSSSTLANSKGGLSVAPHHLHGVSVSAQAAGAVGLSGYSISNLPVRRSILPAIPGNSMQMQLPNFHMSAEKSANKEKDREEEFHVQREESEMKQLNNPLIGDDHAHVELEGQTASPKSARSPTSLRSPTGPSAAGGGGDEPSHNQLPGIPAEENEQHS